MITNKYLILLILLVIIACKEKTAIEQYEIGDCFEYIFNSYEDKLEKKIVDIKLINMFKEDSSIIYVLDNTGPFTIKVNKSGLFKATIYDYYFNDALKIIPFSPDSNGVTILAKDTTVVCNNITYEKCIITRHYFFSHGENQYWEYCYSNKNGMIWIKAGVGTNKANFDFIFNNHKKKCSKPKEVFDLSFDNLKSELSIVVRDENIRKSLNFIVITKYDFWQVNNDKLMKIPIESDKTKKIYVFALDKKSNIIEAKDVELKK